MPALLFRTPPPRSPAPFDMVNPEIETLMLPDVMSKTRNCEVPPAVERCIVKAFAPGPDMVKPLLISNSPLVRMMMLADGREKVIVSPEAASLMAWRKEPGPLSLVLVTVRIDDGAAKMVPIVWCRIDRPSAAARDIL